MDAEKSSKLLAVGRFVMVAGLALAVVGAILWGPEFLRDRRLAHADAVVSELEARVESKDGAVLFYPHFRFRLADGTVVEAAGKQGADPAEWAVGDRVRVAFPAAAPTDVQQASTWTVYRNAILCGVIGLAGFDLGAVLWWWGRRRALARGARPGKSRQREHIEALFGRAGGYRPSDPR